MTLTTEKTKNEETIRGDSSWAQDEVIKCQVGSQVCLCSAAVQPILDSDTEWCRLGNTPNDARWPHSFEGKSSKLPLPPSSFHDIFASSHNLVRPSVGRSDEGVNNSRLTQFVLHPLLALSQRASRKQEGKLRPSLVLYYHVWDRFRSQPPSKVLSSLPIALHFLSPLWRLCLPHFCSLGLGASVHFTQKKYMKWWRGGIQNPITVSLASLQVEVWHGLT